MISLLTAVLTAVYTICAILLTSYALGSIILLIAYLRHRREARELPPIDEYPTVAVQLPIFNEMYVVERLLDSVAGQDYPREKLIIQVLDDSTDETVEVTARKAAQLREQGYRVEHVRRSSRKGFKAGALAYGLELLKAEQVEFVAVLDADFVPHPDFLKRMVPHLVADPKLGMVQARWSHLNTFDSLLTLGQTLALDAHFVVEQTARNRSGWLMNFNGTGGVWRVRTIEDAGGWQDGTLTEDLDLSYRAQLAGWQFLYLPDVEVPGELPPQISAYKQQQSRWAKGGTQCMALLLRPIWKSPRLNFAQRVIATLHLGQYLVHPIIITLLLLTPPLLAMDALDRLAVPLGPLGLAGLGPPLIFVISQRVLYSDWRRRAVALPALIALGTGMALTNARAVIGALLGQQEEFKRTPKFAANQHANKYALRLNANVKWEILLSIYAWIGFILALRYAVTLAPYMAIYAFAFGLIAFWGLRDFIQLKRAQQSLKAQRAPAAR